jgi:cyclohexanone monooxygenase
MTSFNDLITNREANDTAAEFVRAKIRETVHDPKVAEALAPTDHPIGTKRICVDTEYFETYNQRNVSLVNLRQTPIAAIEADGIRLADGTKHCVDAIVYATGFDAMTGALLNVDPTGTGGRRLADKWEAGPRTYLGLMTAEFPNFFMITGPGSPSVLTNMILSIEQHVDFVTDCLVEMRRRGRTRIEATQEAEDSWVAHNDEVAQRTLYPSAGSWYMGANVPGKPRVFMPYIGGAGVYRQICEEVAAKGYDGFRFSTAAEIEERSAAE